MKNLLICIVFSCFFVGAAPSEYSVKILDIYDGDTVTLEYDLGFGLKRTAKARIYGINAPEIKGNESPFGVQARNLLIQLCRDMPASAKVAGNDKFGRDLVSLKCSDLDVATEMIKYKQAVAYFGDKKEPWGAK